MFYTRPNLPQLGIDLVDDVGGGGSCPSQFWGRTADGREVYIRYRGGQLSVSVGKSREVPGDDVLIAQIGPPLDGDMLLEQACDLTGITIRGQKPSLSEEEWREAVEECPVMDWSGRTTYWIYDVLTSRKGGERLAHELAADFPGMRIVEVTWLQDPFRRVCVPRETIGACKDSAVFGFGVDEQRFARLISGKPVQIADLDRAFAHHLDLRIRWNEEVRPPEEGWAKLGIELAESRRLPGNVQLPGFSLLSGLDTKFRTADPEGQRYARKLIETFQRCFSEWAEEVDLATSKVVGTRQMRWYSVDLRGWCQAAPNRFLSWYSEEEGLQRKIGLRPAHAPV